MRIRRHLIVLAAGLAPFAAAAQDGGSVTGPSLREVAPSRFGDRKPDLAYGAYQRGYYLTALRHAMPRAEAGDAAAQTLVAEILSRGLGVPRDLEAAARWYEAAAIQGVPEAQFQTALMLLEGEVLEPDRARAKELMKAAADAGNRLAQFNYAQLLLEEETDEAEAQATEYFRKAAENGLADAQYALAKIYESGVGDVPADPQKALEWMARAAQQGFDTAQVELGTWFVEGTYGPRRLEAGFGWIRTAAERGNVAARNRLAKLYVYGLGVEGDSVEAAAWYMLAREAGLTDLEMEDHLAGLTEAQLSAARARMEELR